MTVSNEALLEGVLAVAERVQVLREELKYREPADYAGGYPITMIFERTAPVLAKLREAPLPAEEEVFRKGFPHCDVCGSSAWYCTVCARHKSQPTVGLDPVALERASEAYLRAGGTVVHGRLLAAAIETYLREAGQPKGGV